MLRNVAVVLFELKSWSKNVLCTQMYHFLGLITHLEKRVSTTAYVNLCFCFQPSHKVHRAAIKLDERMRILMRNLPIMLNRYDQIRQGISEQDIQEENQAPQNSPLTTCTNKQPESSSGARDSSHGAVDDKNEAEATAASTVNESEEV